MSGCVVSLLVLALFSLSCIIEDANTIRCMNNRSPGNQTTLHLLALVPLENEGDPSARCVDRGEELVIAAEIAAEKINNNSNILQGFDLQIISAKTDKCTDASIAESLESFVREITDAANTVVGVIGLVCSSVMLSISPLASLPELNILLISSSTSPPSSVIRSRETVTGLYQVAPSLETYNDAVISLMKANDWRSISVIRHTDSLSVDHDALASDFQEKVAKDESLSISEYEETISGVDRILGAIQSTGVRIIYASVTDQEARDLLCESYRRDIVWPHYAWILHDHSLEQLKMNTSGCSQEEILKALANVTILYHDIDDNPDRVIANNITLNYTYGEYTSLYRERLMALKNDNRSTLCGQDPHIISANALHDSVLAFAHALDTSTLTDVDLQCYGLGSESATSEINDNLQSVNFTGAGGTINFNQSTNELKIQASVNIYRVVNGELTLYALYDSIASNLTEINNQIEYIPNRFDREIIRIPLVLSILTLVVVILLVILTTTIPFLFLHYRDSPDIKATSPQLSLVMLAACYLLYASVALSAVRYRFLTGESFAACCISEQWCWLIGIQLIFATLSVRLLRVFRIFYNYNDVGKYWSTCSLAIYIMLIISITVIILIVWLLVKRPTVVENETYLPNATPPKFTVELSCSDSDPVFLTLVLIYTGLFMVFVLVLAIKTRKVKIDSFKDTKSINAYVYISVSIIALFIPLSYIIAFSQGVVVLALSYTLRVTALIMVALACKCFLFLPKVYSSSFADKQSRYSDP